MDDELEENATTLIFKLSKKLTQKDFLEVLNLYWQPPENQTPAYDFVHLPWKKLAVVNFTSPEACQSCLRVMRALVGSHDVWIVDLQQAKHQGLNENIAAFCSRATPVSFPKPLVFESGREITWEQAVQTFLASAPLPHGEADRADRTAETASCSSSSKDVSFPLALPEPTPPLERTQADFLQLISEDLRKCVHVEAGMVIFRL
ncbi:unnamed protein product [Symbiodinium sp. CCMP2592]|nr:unnamed protein product [Symbiodinium sp. CCMP2592]